MKMYLNIIRNNLEVRNYPTKKCVCFFYVDNEAVLMVKVFGARGEKNVTRKS